MFIFSKSVPIYVHIWLCTVFSCLRVRRMKIALLDVYGAATVVGTLVSEAENLVRQ